MSDNEPSQGIGKGISEEDAAGRLKFVKASSPPERAGLNSYFVAAVDNETNALDSPDSNLHANSGSLGCDFEMEAPISEDDVIRAGGLGAMDDIGSVLPSAMDATDFEASQRDARDYEDAEDDAISRPGLGLLDPSEYKQDSLGDFRKILSQEECEKFRHLQE